MIVYAQLIGARLSQSSYKTVLSCGALSGVNRCKVISFLFRYRYQRRALIDSARARRKNKPAKQKRFGVYGDAHWWRDHQALILILVSFLPLMRLIVLLLLFSYFWSKKGKITSTWIHVVQRMASSYGASKLAVLRVQLEQCAGDSRASSFIG